MNWATGCGDPGGSLLSLIVKGLLLSRPRNGTLVAAAADSTPGISRIAWRRRSWNAGHRCSWRYAPGTAMFTVRTFAASNPGSTEIAFAKLRARRPAPLKRTRAAAIWPVTRKLLNILTPGPPDEPFAFTGIPSVSLVRRILSTGRNPTTRPTKRKRPG